MLARVVALEDAEYEARLEGPESVELAVYDPAGLFVAAIEADGERQLTLADMGERVANRQGCLRCHTTDGTPHIGPTWARMYGSTVILDSGATVVADEAYITESMMDPLAKLHRGFQPVMPSYQGLITAAETGAIVEYIKTLRSVPVLQGQEPLPQGTGGTVTIPIPAQPREDVESGRQGGALEPAPDTVEELLEQGGRESAEEVPR
jgi:cytochrome c oxidase subunit 2